MSEVDAWIELLKIFALVALILGAIAFRLFEKLGAWIARKFIK